MAANKTQPTVQSVAACLDAIADAPRRADCQQLADLMQRLTGCAPVMWGAGLIGFDRYHYRYDSGREGDFFVIGFSPRKNDISVYLPCSGSAQTALLAKLGKHKMGKGCLYMRKLSDIDSDIFEQLVTDAVAEVKRKNA